MEFGTRLIWNLAYSAILTLGIISKLTCGQIGLSYSPFVGMEGPGSNKYTLADVKLMLKLIQDKGYHKITTYGVGVSSQPGEHKKNETWRKSDSAVYAALAAAESNNESMALSLTVYQGIFMNDPIHDIQQVDVEVEVGFEMAELANSIYNGTVESIVFPSSISVNGLVTNGARIVDVAKRTRQLGMKSGVRVLDCPTIATRRNAVVNILQEMDFVICLILPDNALGLDPEKFLKSTVQKQIEMANAAVKSFVGANSRSIHLIPETGWPAGENLDQENANAKNMLRFWHLTEEWAKGKEHQYQVFMHEAFDNPWKLTQIPSPVAAYYGRWRAKDGSSSEYELKIDKDPNPIRKSSPSWELIFGVVFGSILFILLVLMIMYAYRRVMKFDGRTRLSVEEIRQFLNGTNLNESVMETGGNDDAWARMPYNRDFELAKQKFSIDKTVLLGSGTFGLVFKGRIDGLISDVAFKTTRPDCPVTALRGILSEIKILTYLGKHENVVSICGACTVEIEKGIIYVATELCINGSLESILRKNGSNYNTVDNSRYVNLPSNTHPKQFTDFQLLRWALEISSAMEYISSKNIIHADLATRNVLLTLDLTAKVTDFGLSRRLYEYTEYVKKQQEPLPWRWMAIESLKHLQFSVKSDIWSYGITVWEIFSLGTQPYPGLTWTINFVTELENGLRMQRPSRASEKMYEIMVTCWDIEPSRRPTFSKLKEILLAMSIQLQNAGKATTGEKTT